ncbi:MAG: bifunctional UDP-4-keto-pentose/UDP-xylose synthase [Holosporales bacterium]
MNLFILGVNGFIGSSLLEACLKKKNWNVVGIDLQEDKIRPFLSHPRFLFRHGDMCLETQWIEKQIAACDVIMPLAAIADPALYVTDPLRVFHLDFEANLPLVRACVRHKKRLLFPSTSEVYGMSTDTPFKEDTSPLTVGPISKQRWIYSASKQLLDRVIFAHGEKDGLDYTIFRPFNWIGFRQDSIDLVDGGRGRVIVQMLGNIIRGKNIQIVDGGSQRRCFTDIEDAVEALLLMLENPEKTCGQIFNVGNPDNDSSIADLGKKLLSIVQEHPLCPPKALTVQLENVSSLEHFGKAYQDIQARVPSISKITEALNWQPRICLEDSLKGIVDAHLNRLFPAKN